MDKFTALIFKCMWQLLYYLVSTYEFGLWLHFRIIAFALWSYDLCLTPEERKRNEYDFLQRCRKHLNKIPKHLNLIIGPENSQVDDDLLRRIFSYALYMDINCVSYYDTRCKNFTSNSSKSRLSVLEKLNCPKGWKRKNISTHHSMWYICKSETTNGTTKHKINGVNGTSNPPNSTNGHLPSLLKTTDVLENKTLEIYEIQPHNNHSLIAQICRDLFRQRHTAGIQKLLNQRTSLTERLNQELALHLENLTEPELSIIFDENICTFGMLPWHTRFTEFHRQANGQHFDVKTFAHILYKYSRCEQRWGK